MMTKVNKDMLIGDILKEDMSIAAILMGAGMHCITCGIAQYESLEEACLVHGIPADPVVDTINAYLESKAEAQV